MKKFTFYLLLNIYFYSNSYSQVGNYEAGARAAGMANASITLEDPYSIFNNVGGLGSGKIKGTSVLFAYQNRFGINALSNLNAAIILPTKIGTHGISIFRTGDALYNEHKVGLAYANKFGLTSIGAQVNYLQYYLEGFGSRKVLSLELGAVAEITHQLFFGAYISNINQARISKKTDERIPTILKTGISYRPLSKLMFNIEVEKDLDYSPSIKSGLEYEIIKKLVLRTGLATNPFRNYFGIGFKARNLTLDYSLSTHMIGLTHNAGVLYNFNKGK